MRRMEEELNRQNALLQEAYGRLRSTNEELWKVQTINEALLIRNQELERTLQLQRSGSCQNVCCKGLNYSKDPLNDASCALLTEQVSDPLGVLMRQMCCCD